MSSFRKLALASVSVLSLATPALAQPAASTQPAADAVVDSEIIVTARRRDESVQDVPLTVNAVKAESLAKLNIRDFKDIASLVPGLTLTPAVDGIAPVATLRGVNYDVNNSGSNGTVQFYLNDAPVGAAHLLQAMFDLGQIEVLRGPQGTLRGIASPSGSITASTHKPDLYKIGGYATATANDIGGINVNGAVNLPIIEGMLAIRVAGLVNDDEANHVRSVNDPSFTPFTRGRAERVSVRFDPIDNLDINASYQHYLNNAQYFDQVESAGVATGTAVTGALINGKDRGSVEYAPRVVRQEYNVYNLQAEWKVAGQRLNYVGGWTTQQIHSVFHDDIGAAFGSRGFTGNPTANPLTSPNLLNYGQQTQSRSAQYAQELRLSSDARVAGIFDYVVGALINRQSAPTSLIFQTPVFIAGAAPSASAAPFTPGSLITIAQTPFNLSGRTLERSVYGNVIAHIGASTEVSGGLRFIHFNNISSLTGQTNYHSKVYSLSIKHRFNENIMAYASTGSSWRVGSGTNGVIIGSSGSTSFSDPALIGILGATPEKSKSYEAGIKTDWFDKTLRFNLTYYHQNFDNYIFSSPKVVFLAYNGTSYFPALSRAGLSVGVPVKVDGVETELSFQPSKNLSIDATVSYSMGKVSNGLVPCTGTSLPVAPKQLNFCTVSQRASNNAPFNATLGGEYNHAINGLLDGFLRGQFAYHGDSQTEPSNPYDDVKAYGTLNLFAGVHDASGAWELTAFAKNIFNTQRVLTRDISPALASYADTAGSGGALVSNYRSVTSTAPREFGLTVRYAFGAR